MEYHGSCIQQSLYSYGVHTAELKSLLDEARQARKAAAAESQKKLADLRTALEKARQKAIEESDKDMAEMKRRIDTKRDELEKQAEVMQAKLSSAKRKVRGVFTFVFYRASEYDLS